MSLIGQNAPDFTLPGTDKKPVSLSDFRGQQVVLAFYPAAFTGVCTTEMCTFQSQLSRLNDANAVVLGISADAPFSNGKFAALNDLSFALLSDYKREAISAYGVALENFAGLPGYTAAQRSVFIIDADGKVSYEWIAPNPGVEPNYDEVIAAL